MVRSVVVDVDVVKVVVQEAAGTVTVVEPLLPVEVIVVVTS